MNLKFNVCLLAAGIAGVVYASAVKSWHFSDDLPAGGYPQRVCWDVDHKFDIPEKGHIFFGFVCSNIEACYRFTLHARRGSLWVPLRIESEVASGATQYIRAVRKDWLLKDLPGRKLDRWDGFDGFRLSAWRATDEAFSVKCSILDFTVSDEEIRDPSPKPVPKLAPVPGERRLAWCHRGWGMSEKTTWDGTIRSLRNCGFTDVIPNMCRPGGAYYNSKVLPVQPYVSQHGDQLESCLKACRKYGLKCHVWKVCWNIGKHAGFAVDGFVDRMRKEGRLARTSTGEERSWLCPSHPANLKAEIDTMLELASKGVDGVHFDFIRYSGMDVCFCDRCKTAFEAKYGKPVDWKKLQNPNPDTKGSGLRRAWTDFRCGNITRLIREASSRLRAQYPKVEISAAVFSMEGEMVRVNVAQDWGLWCRNGYVDFVCPMDYVNSVPMFRRTIERHKKVLNGVKCYPGIGYSVMRTKPYADKPVRLAEQVMAVRECGYPGFTVFDYTPPTATALKKVFGRRNPK